MSNILDKYNTKFLRSVILIVLMSFLVPNIPVNSQTQQFSQFYAAPLYLAPSFAGATDGSRVALNYRNQWPELPGTFATFAFSFDHYFDEYNSGVGVMLFRDQAGSVNLSTTNAGFLYSYNIKINRDWSLRPGLHFLYSQRTIDYGNFVFGDQLNLDGNYSGSRTSVSVDKVDFFDASSSLVAYRQPLWMGVSFDHLMTPNQSITAEEFNIPLKTSIFGGYRFHFGNALFGGADESASVTFLYKNQGSFNQLDIGAYWTKEPISLGLIYRGIPVFKNPAYGNYIQDAVVTMLAIRTQDIRVGYSYDFTVSNLLGATGGSHEISIIYEFNQEQTRRRRDPCVYPCTYSPYD